jgi:hypothetical protein
MESLTRKEKVAQYLLSQNKWMSAVDIANGLGVDKELIYPVMRGVLREKRYSVESKLAPRNMADGPMNIKVYLITAIEPAAPKPAPKVVVKKKAPVNKMEDPQIGWITDPISIRARLRDCIANVRCEAAL